MPDSRKYTEAQKQSARKWDAANLDRISIAVPKGQKDTIKAHAEARGESVNGFVNRAIAETMERDNGAPAGPETEKPQA
ncbi:ABC transporter ATP-binding protein [Muriventricola aceti]|uniref:ABC transporter ATP-binding protein n=1 Tax=Muriventricola aceti TaxID=2981773 RepID=UPI003EBAC9CC